MNTWFEQSLKNRYTWMSADGQSKNQIDFTLMSQRYRNSVKNVKVKSSANCGSDHNLVMAKLQIKWKNIRRSRRVPRWKRDALLSPNKKKSLRIL